MRYFTKELCGGGMYLPVSLLEEDERAAVFSEAYFQELYDAKLQEHLNQMRAAQKTLGDKLLKPGQGRDANREIFKAEYEHTLRYIRQNYPPKLLKKVADLRLMAVGVVAPGIKDEVSKYSAEFGARLREEAEAAVFSEAYFQKIYEEQLAERARLSEKMSAAFAGIMQKVSGEAFDEERHTQAFWNMYESRLAGFMRGCPPELLEKVADPRVLGLFVVSPQVKAMFVRLNEEDAKRQQMKHRMFEENIQTYRRLYKELLWKQPGPFLNEFGFHDVGIRELGRQGDDFVMELGGGCGYTRVARIIFENAEILTMEDGLSGAYWLYEEVYEHEGGFEIHILACNNHREKKDSLAELVLCAKNVRYEYKEAVTNR